MALRFLTHFDDELFRKTSKPVVKFDERLEILLQDMQETLKEINGFGCAAVHVGVLRRVVVILSETGVIELVNPVITQVSEETQSRLEGSIAPGAPGARVTRPKKVTVSALDRSGNPITITGEGFLAATFCHEIEHLDGILYTDKAEEIYD